MADVTINQLTSLGAAPDAADEYAVWDVSGGVTRKVTQAQVLTGVATLAVANTFTAAQTVSGANGSGVLAGNAVSISNQAAGAGGRGAYVEVGRNSTDSAPAHIVLISGSSGSNNCFVWPDDSGILRILQSSSGAWPTASNRNSAGTVVGAQTSSLDSKDIIEGVTKIADVLAAVRAGAEAVRRFQYKAAAPEQRDKAGNETINAKASRHFNGEQFEGVIIDFAPRYGMDTDKDHPAGKSLNMVNAIGDLLRAVAWLVEREQARGA